MDLLANRDLYAQIAINSAIWRLALRHVFKESLELKF